MGDFRQTATVFMTTLGLTAIGWSLAAQAQMSPFAKKGPQAWETAGDRAPTNAPAPTNTGTYQPSGALSQPSQSSTTSYPSTYTHSIPTSRPATNSYQPQSTYSGGTAAQAPTVSSGGTPYSSSGGTPYPSTYSSGTASSPYTGMTQNQPVVQAPTQASMPRQSTSPFASQAGAPPSGAAPGASYEYPTYNRTAPSQPVLRGTQSGAAGTYYPGRENPYSTGQRPSRQTQQARGTYNPPQQQGYQYPYGQPRQQQGQKRSITDKLGLRNVAFSYDGYLKGGAAITKRDIPGIDDGWGEDFILDGALRAEVSAITQGGLEYGLAAEARGQYDQYRRGFGGLVGDCPAGIVGCSTDGAGNVLRGHTSRFYASGANDAKDFEAQLESAHLFLRSAYGDITIGRDDGAAYLFSLGAPTLLNVGASNNAVDYTGLDAVKTVNDASGFAEKITYTSPRLLGDQVGVGIQFGASYALDAKACGVDYCVRGNDDEPVGVIAPDLKNVAEFGVALDRKFSNGMSVEATATYAMASEDSGLDVFDDLQALGLGLELGYMDWTLGGSYLQSNNALADGDYTSMDVGLTWQPSKLGLTLGYGQAEDDNVGLKSQQAVAGISYDWNESFRIGLGAQYVDRDVNVVTNGLISDRNEKAVSGFIEGRFTF